MLVFNIYYKTKTLYDCPDKMLINYSKFIQYIFPTSLLHHIILWGICNFLIYIVFPEYKNFKLLQIFKDFRIFILLTIITTISCSINARSIISKG